MKTCLSSYRNKSAPNTRESIRYQCFQLFLHGFHCVLLCSERRSFQSPQSTTVTEPAVDHQCMNQEAYADVINSRHEVTMLSKAAAADNEERTPPRKSNEINSEVL